MQTLVLEGKTLNVDASFKDDGEPPVYGVVGNQRTLLNPGKAGHNEVFCYEGQYFFKNGELCTKPEDVDWIGEPFRTEALAFVEQLRAKPAPKDRRGNELPRRVKVPRRIRLQTRGEVLGGKKVTLDVSSVDREVQRLEKAGVKD